ncbi:unannotated protein [freshwater metagenome]|uniref:Unannotated protein n=1 Tax=freshwater metagenome TaxID=449393 RepID=A0A6J7SJI5_9ZZZZ
MSSFHDVMIVNAPTKLKALLRNARAARPMLSLVRSFGSKFLDAALTTSNVRTHSARIIRKTMGNESPESHSNTVTKGHARDSS